MQRENAVGGSVAMAMTTPEPSESVAFRLDTLPADVAHAVLEHLDAALLARMRSVGTGLRSLVDAIAADLLTRHMQECRRRAARRVSFLPRGQSAASFVGSVADGRLRLLGGMCCGGPTRRRSLHAHELRSGTGSWLAASYCGRQALLLRSDGVVLGDGPALRGADGDHCECCCEADAEGTDGAEAEDDEGLDGVAGWEEQLMLEQEEEARSRGWGWQRPQHADSFGLASASSSLQTTLLEIPEVATAVRACPGRSHVLGASGAVYSARWVGQAGSSGRGFVSPWTCWTPPSAGFAVTAIAAGSAHVVLATAGGHAMAFGDPQDGKLGFSAHTAYVTTPRAVDALAPHRVVGVAAGQRHSLFLTLDGECYAAGADDSGQCGGVGVESRGPRPSRPSSAVRHVARPPGCAPLVQVSAGLAHSVLLSHDGRVHACGLNDRGQCGVDSTDGTPTAHGGTCVPQLTLVVDLVQHVVRAVDAAASLTVFEADAAVCDAEVEGGAAGDASGASSGRASLDVGGVSRRGRMTPLAASSAAGGPSLWLAGNIESFNVPGTVSAVGGLHFLPSCYKWQHLTAASGRHYE